MFSLREFIKNGLLKAIGKMADYQIILNAAGWYDKGVLVDEDLMQIQEAVDGQQTAETETEIEVSATAATAERESDMSADAEGVSE